MTGHWGIENVNERVIHSWDPTEICHDHAMLLDYLILRMFYQNDQKWVNHMSINKSGVTPILITECWLWNSRKRSGLVLLQFGAADGQSCAVFSLYCEVLIQDLQLPANTRHWPNAGPMLVHRRRRGPALVQHWVNVLCWLPRALPI